MTHTHSCSISAVVLIPLATILLLLALAMPAPAASFMPSAAPAGLQGDPPLPAGGEMMAIDVPADTAPILQRLLIHYQAEPRSGLLRAAATAAQLAALRQEGINYAEISKVAIFDKNNRQLSDIYCNGANYSNYTIPYWYSYNYVYSPINLSCYGAGTVDWIDVHYVLQNVYANVPPGSGLNEVGVVVGRNVPQWNYVTLETFDYCAPSGPVLDAPTTYDRWVFNVDATYGMNVFHGIPVNQQYNLAVTDYCNGNPVGSIGYWELYVYYVAPTPTITSTPTTSRTPTLTGTPANTPTRTSTRPATATPTPTRTSTRPAAASPTPTRTPTRTMTPSWRPRYRLYLPIILRQ